MSFAVITTWELQDGADWGLFLRNVNEHRLPALKALGATRVTVIRTSARTVAALSEWPDKITRDDAIHAIEPSLLRWLAWGASRVPAAGR